MRILYDHQIFAIQDFGGISRCFVELYKNLPRGVDADISLKESDNAYIRELRVPEVRPKKEGINHFICRRPFPGKWHLYEWYNKLWKRKERPDYNLKHSIEALKKGNFDVFHPTFFGGYFLPYLNGKPFVLTIHDMTPELYPQQYAEDDFQIIMKRKLAPLASAIIAVSENTKQDIIRLLNIPEKKVHVVYHGSSLPIPATSHPPFHFPYILFVGSRQGYKNFVTFIQEAAPIIKKYPDLHVVCTGLPFDNDEEQLFLTYGIHQRMVNKWARTDSELYSLYHHAKCFVYPSEYEGFGIPILEAYQANCPVLLNNASCFPEIARDAAFYFDIHSHHSLAEQLDTILSMNLDTRKALLTKQCTRLHDFSWQKSAEELTQIYRSLI